MRVLPEGNIQHLWYTRRGNTISGPHPLKQIQRFIILGRINEKDELSTDRKSWKRLTQLTEIIPEVARDVSSPEADQRLIAERMKEDERKFDDRRGDRFNVNVNRRGGDRRKPESATILEYRKFKSELSKERLPKKPSRKAEIAVLVGVTSLVLSIGVLLTLYPNHEPVHLNQVCSGQPQPGVDWTNCQLQGAQLQGKSMSGSRLRSANLSGANLSGAKLKNSDLSYADLSIAKLQGANLTGAILTGTAFKKADLSGVNFSGADLSYANLAEATMAGARLENAKLDNAIWVDASICQPGSVGRCIKTQATADSSP